jgi:3-oxoacyl-[acyl-carrier protein] reductase
VVGEIAANAIASTRDPRSTGRSVGGGEGSALEFAAAIRDRIYPRRARDTHPRAGVADAEPPAPAILAGMDLGIEGRVALVGGATQGIGRAIAQALIAEGVTVAITARDEERTAGVASEIGAAAGFGWDSADLAGAEGLVQRVRAEVGEIDILITNTGGPPTGADPLSFSDEQWEGAHRTLVMAPIALARLVLPGMRERHWGRIVGVASTSVREPIPVLMLSNAERSATLAAYKTLALQFAGDGITINTLLTGSIATERSVKMHGSMDAAERAAAAHVPAGRIGRPEEMGWAAAFLCSDRAAFITGAALPVDGGVLRGI